MESLDGSKEMAFVDGFWVAGGGFRVSLANSRADARYWMLKVMDCRPSTVLNAQSPN